MRTALAVSLLLLSAGCTPRCKPGTLFVTLSFSGTTTMADTISVDVNVAGLGERTTMVPVSRGRAAATLEVDLSRYVVGQQATITVTAHAGATRLGSGTASHPLAASCDLFSVDIAPDAAVPSLRLLAGGLGGQGSADGTGPTARFLGPAALTIDDHGNLYVADTFNHTIRKVDIATGTVTTVAGRAGVSGSADGSAGSSRLNAPGGIIWDGHDSLYIADTGNHIIRKLTAATGALTTVAGMPETAGAVDGSGSTARFNGPSGITIDGQGTLYVADGDNDTIRKVTVATADVATLAGAAGTSGFADGAGAAARFDLPAAITTDGQGNLYIAESVNQTIRRLAIATGAVTTLAGTAQHNGNADGTGASAQFYGPSGIIYDGQGNLYIADNGNSSIRRIAIATRLVTTLAGDGSMHGSADGVGTSALFSYPGGITADGQGNLYIADSENGSIRRIVIATATVTTLAGSLPMEGATNGLGSAARFLRPRGVAVDKDGVLYVADNYNYMIRKISADGGVTTLAGTSKQGYFDGTGGAAQFSNPVSVAVDQSDLYVADSSNSCIREVELATGTVTTFAGKAGSRGSVDGTGAAARFTLPSSIASDGQGSLYIADPGDYTVRKLVIASGDVTTLAGAAGIAGTVDGVGGEARFQAPQGIAADGNGNVYVSDFSSNTIRKVIISSGIVTAIAGKAGDDGSTDGIGANARFSAPGELAADRRGNLYVADTASHAIRKVVLATREVTTIIGNAERAGVLPGPLPASLNGPAGLALLPNGRLAIVDTAENAVLVADLPP